MFTSISVFTAVTGGVMSLHFYEGGVRLFLLGMFLFAASLTCWFRDVVREATYEGKHTKLVQKGLRIGFFLFIVSEIMFFFAFFWAYFHVSLDPAVEIGAVWPPHGIKPINPWGLPLLNTAILLTSGVFVTAGHHLLISGSTTESAEQFFLAKAFGVCFLFLQISEYSQASFDISDGIYGSVFYMTTGFHGLHVLVGVIFLAVCFFRFYLGHFTKERHLGYEFAIYYWHFVDVVWLFLYIVIYWYGSL